MIREGWLDDSRRVVGWFAKGLWMVREGSLDGSRRVVGWFAKLCGSFNVLRNPVLKVFNHITKIVYMYEYIH